MYIASSVHASTGEGGEEDEDPGAPEALQKEWVESDVDGGQEADGIIRDVVVLVVKDRERAVVLVVEVKDRERAVAVVGEEHEGLLVVVVVEDLVLDGGLYETPCFRMSSDEQQYNLHKCCAVFKDLELFTYTTQTHTRKICISFDG